MLLSRGKKVMLGNEAIAYGAVEAGLEVAAGYPGTPSTEIIETLMKIKSGAYVEWSINEKVAFETQSAHDLIIEAFKLSEKFGHPVIFRSTTRIGHVRSQVSYSTSKTVISHTVVKDPKRFVMAPETAIRDRVQQVERFAKIREGIEYLNSLEGDDGSDELVIASGISYAYVKDAINENNLKCRILKLSTPFPIPEKIMASALEGCKRVLIVEENDPIVEMQVKSLMIDRSHRAAAKPVH